MDVMNLQGNFSGTKGAQCRSRRRRAAAGLVVHGMQGFDDDRARKERNVPDDYSVDAMFAVGLPADPADLPQELREREEPSGRKPVADIGGTQPRRSFHVREASR